MPLYDYQCKHCNETKKDVILAVEQLDTVDILCDVCDKPMTRIVGNNGGFRLKGGGWEKDGYNHYIGNINKTRRSAGQPEVDYNDIHGTDF